MSVLLEPIRFLCVFIFLLISQLLVLVFFFHFVKFLSVICLYSYLYVLKPIIFLRIPFAVYAKSIYV